MMMFIFYRFGTFSLGLLFKWNTNDSSNQTFAGPTTEVASSVGTTAATTMCQDHLDICTQFMAQNNCSDNLAQTLCPATCGLCRKSQVQPLETSRKKVQVGGGGGYFFLLCCIALCKYSRLQGMDNVYLGRLVFIFSHFQ